MPTSGTRRRSRRPALPWVAGTAAVAVADQVTKAASARLAGLPGIHPMPNPGLSLELVNTGRWVETAAMLLGLFLAALWLVPRAQTRRGVVATTLILGGSVGNLTDRIVCGFVRDFLHLGPVVVNVADLAVLAGILLLAAASSRPRPAAHRDLPRRTHPGHRPQGSRNDAPVTVKGGG